MAFSGVCLLGERNLQLVICQDSIFGGVLTDLWLDLGEGREAVECK